jgi:hypothetical protein
MTLSLAFLTPDFLVAPVFTDPPYNVPMKGHAGGKGRRKHREFPMASGGCYLAACYWRVDKI